MTNDIGPPPELRKLARAELAAYPTVDVRTRERFFSLREDGAAFVAAVGRREPADEVRARAVLLATGLRETLPPVPGLLGFYGMTLFSCAACDAFELRGQSLALFGQTADLADRARLIARWSGSLTVFTHGADVIDAVAEAELAALGVTVERELVAELIGLKGRLESVARADGRTVPVVGGFVRPKWSLDLSFLDGFEPARDADGHLVTDGSGRTSIPGLYAAGDAAAPGPQQLIVAAGTGARAAAVIVHDAIGVTAAH